MAYLPQCPSCLRHVHAHEPHCPFCGGDVPARSSRKPPGRRLSRAGILAFGAAAMIGCGASTGPTVDGGGETDAGMASMDAGARDAGFDGGTDAGFDGGTDAGPDAGEFDAGEIALPYGAPPMRESYV